MIEQPVLEDKVSLSKLWRQSGRTMRFKDFCQQFNERNGFKNLTGTGDGSQSLQSMMPAIEPGEPAVAQLAPAPVVPVKALGKGQSALYIVFGVAAGVVGVLLYNKYSRK